MTIVGKILVFVNLIFSLVVGGLVMMVYMTRTNWEDGYNKINAQKQAVEADRRQLSADFDAAKKDYDTRVTALSKERDDAVAGQNAAKLELKRKGEELDALKSDDNRKAADNKSIETAAEVRKTQIRELEAANQKLREDKVELIQQKNEERKARIQSDVNEKTFRTRAFDLEAQLRDMAREMIKNRSGSTSGFVVRKRGDENPPPDNVEGRIKEVDPEDGLVKLSIGSDAGLAQGHTLKVFRLDPIPERSRYLGTIEILTVRPHEAVGRPTSRVPVSIRPGDRVASRLLVGGN